MVRLVEVGHVHPLEGVPQHAPRHGLVRPQRGQEVVVRRPELQGLLNPGDGIRRSQGNDDLRTPIQLVNSTVLDDNGEAGVVLDAVSGRRGQKTVRDVDGVVLRLQELCYTTGLLQVSSLNDDEAGPHNLLLDDADGALEKEGFVVWMKLQMSLGEAERGHVVNAAEDELLVSLAIEDERLIEAEETGPGFDVLGHHVRGLAELVDVVRSQVFQDLFEDVGHPLELFKGVVGR